MVAVDGHLRDEAGPTSPSTTSSPSPSSTTAWTTAHVDEASSSDTVASVALASPPPSSSSLPPPPSEALAVLSFSPSADMTSIAQRMHAAPSDMVAAVAAAAAQAAAQTDDDESDITDEPQHAGRQDSGTGWSMLPSSSPYAALVRSNAAITGNGCSNPAASGHPTRGRSLFASLAGLNYLPASATVPAPSSSLGATGCEPRSSSGKGRGWGGETPDAEHESRSVGLSRSPSGSRAPSRGPSFSVPSGSASSPSAANLGSPRIGRFAIGSPAGALRMAPEKPAEGAGLRGMDEDEDVKADVESSAATATSSAPTPTTVEAQLHNHTPANDVVVHHQTPLIPPATRNLCIRHQRMADEGTTARLQKSIESLPLSDQTAVNTVWSLFSSSPHPRRALILQGILTMCCFSQLSLLSSELSLAIRIDPFSLFPREVSLKVLGHLDAMSLGRAAQVSRHWKTLADDDMLWRNMCEQHIERKCEKCGWGLPLLSERRRRIKGPPLKAGTKESTQLTIDPPVSAPHQHAPHSSSSASASSSGNLKRTITAAANAAAHERLWRNADAHAATSSNAPTPMAASRETSPRAGADNDEDSEGADVDMRGDPGSPQADRPAKRQCNSTTRESSSQPSSAASSCVLPPPVPATRPWKSVYCERLAIERNWRRGRFTTRTLKGHTDGIMCLQYSDALAHPSFPVVITGSYDRTARIWNFETGEELRVLRGHSRGVRCLQFDEAKLITGSMDRTIKIWNWRTGTLMRTLEGHTEGIVCLHFNDYLLASGSADSNIKVWNFKTGECFTLRGHSDWVNAVLLWSSAGRQAQAKAALKRGHTATTSTPEEWSRQDGTGSATRASVASKGGSASPDADGFLFSASDDGTIMLWDLEERECLMRYEGHHGQVQSIKLVMLDEEAVHRISQTSNGTETEGHRRRSSAAGSTAAPANGANADNGAQRFQGPAESTSFTDPNASFFAQPTADVSSRLSSGRTYQVGGSSAFGGHSRSTSRQSTLDAQAAAESRRRKIPENLLRVQERLCAAGLVEPLPIDAELADIQGVLAEPADRRQRPSTSPERPGGARKGEHRPILISGSLDNTLKLWDVRTGRCIRTLFGHVEGIWAVDVDKLRLASASHDKTVKVWDRESGNSIATLVGHRSAVTCISLGDDKIISGSDDGEIRVWDFSPAP